MGIVGFARNTGKRKAVGAGIAVRKGGGNDPFLKQTVVKASRAREEDLAQQIHAKIAAQSRFGVFQRQGILDPNAKQGL